MAVSPAVWRVCPWGCRRCPLRCPGRMCQHPPWWLECPHCWELPRPPRTQPPPAARAAVCPRPAWSGSVCVCDLGLTLTLHCLPSLRQPTPGSTFNKQTVREHWSIIIRWARVISGPHCTPTQSVLSSHCISEIRSIIWQIHQGSKLTLTRSPNAS